MTSTPADPAGLPAASGRTADATRAGTSTSSKPVSRRRFAGAWKVFDETLISRVQRDHRESDRAFRRRRIIVVLVLLAGATLLAISLNVPQDSKAFYPLTFALAGVWTIGGLASGKLHLGYIQGRKGLVRPIVNPILLGLLLAGVFLAGALIAREIPFLHRIIEAVLGYARQGSLPLIAVITFVNGLAEETFFRGALFAAIGVRYPVIISTVVYTAAMAATGNLMLVFAAVTLGVIWALQRRVTGGILASMITHVVWSEIMLFALPPIMAGG